MQYNSLLAYRPRTFLERMTDAERAALLQEVLRRGESEQTWLAIFELFALWPDSESKFDTLEVADRELDSWDDESRLVDSARRALIDNERLSTVARIVRSIEIYRRDDSAGTELTAVATSGEASRLTRLSIISSQVRDSAWRALIDSPHLTNLSHLHVSNTVMSDTAFLQLLHSDTLTGLRCLKLVDVGIRAIWLSALHDTIPTLRLRTLDISRNFLRDDGARFIADSSLLQSVESLSVQECFMKEPGIRALLTSPHVRELKALDVSKNDVTDDEREALKELAESKQVSLTI